MQIVSGEEMLRAYLKNAVEINEKAAGCWSISTSSAAELEVDAVCDGKEVFVPGIMELVERTGIHSGDSHQRLPHLLGERPGQETILEYTRRLGLAIGIVGLYNIQFIVDAQENVYVIEVNPPLFAHGAVPLQGQRLAALPTSPPAAILGKEPQGAGHCLPLSAGKEALVREGARLLVHQAGRSGRLPLPGDEVHRRGHRLRRQHDPRSLQGPASLGHGGDELRHHPRLPRRPRDKEEALPLVRRFYNLGFNIEATSGTAAFLKSHGIRTRVKKKISDGSEEILDSIRQGYVSYVINTRDMNSLDQLSDGYEIRRCAVENNVTMFTALDTVKVLLDVLEETTLTISTIRRIGGWHEKRSVYRDGE